jgi:hypothetical protein
MNRQTTASGGRTVHPPRPRRRRGAQHLEHAVRGRLAPLLMLFNCSDRKTSVFIFQLLYICCIIYRRKVRAIRHECRDCFLPVRLSLRCTVPACHAADQSAMGVDWSKACASSNATPLDNLISILYGIGGVTVGQTVSAVLPSVRCRTLQATQT